jgi:hypothetical protein
MMHARGTLQKYNPEKLRNEDFVDSALQKYVGKENELVMALAEKYNCDVDAVFAESEDVPGGGEEGAEPCGGEVGEPGSESDEGLTRESVHIGFTQTTLDELDKKDEKVGTYIHTWDEKVGTYIHAWDEKVGTYIHAYTRMYTHACML